MNRLFYLSLLFLLISCGKESQLHFTLPSADYDRMDYAISIILPDELSTENKSPILYEIINNEKVEIPSQILNGFEKELSWVVPGLSKAGLEREFELNLISSTDSDALVATEKNDSTLLIRLGNNEILHYRHAELKAPQDKTQLYNRSGFIHPLYSPSGKVLTWAQPEDHIHHVGLWNPWTRVSWKENNTDFWNLAAGMGTVRYKDVINTVSGPVFAEFHILQDHIAFEPNKPPFPIEDAEESTEIVVMEEEWIIRVWNVDDGYLLDFTSLLRNVLDESISLDAYRYGGGLGYRATSKWNANNSEVLTSEGKTRKDGDATRAKWCWIYGDLEGKQTGMLFMSDSKNFDFPQPMRIWPANITGPGYQYFEFTPIRENAWILEPGETYSQKYRIWVREGEVDPSKAEQQWQQYIDAMDLKISYLSN